MNAYRISVWKSVTHNGEFSHNLAREELIHARNAAEAEGKIILAPAALHGMHGLSIGVSSEIIYSTEKIGTVTKQLFYVYSGGSTPRPCR